MTETPVEPKPASPPPPKHYGFPNGRLRLRASWFGVAVLEEQIEERDGTVRWVKASRFYEVPGGR